MKNDNKNILENQNEIIKNIKSKMNLYFQKKFNNNGKNKFLIIKFYEIKIKKTKKKKLEIKYKDYYIFKNIIGVYIYKNKYKIIRPIFNFKNIFLKEYHRKIKFFLKNFINDYPGNFISLFLTNSLNYHLIQKYLKKRIIKDEKKNSLDNLSKTDLKSLKFSPIKKINSNFINKNLILQFLNETNIQKKEDFMRTPHYYKIRKSSRKKNKEIKCKSLELDIKLKKFKINIAKLNKKIKKKTKTKTKTKTPKNKNANFDHIKSLFYQNKKKENFMSSKKRSKLTFNIEKLNKIKFKKKFYFNTKKNEIFKKNTKNKKITFKRKNIKNFTYRKADINKLLCDSLYKERVNSVDLRRLNSLTHSLKKYVNKNKKIKIYEENNKKNWLKRNKTLERPPMRKILIVKDLKKFFQKNNEFKKKIQNKKSPSQKRSLKKSIFHKEKNARNEKNSLNQKIIKKSFFNKKNNLKKSILKENESKGFNNGPININSNSISRFSFVKTSFLFSEKYNNHKFPKKVKLKFIRDKLLSHFNKKSLFFKT